MTLPPAPLTKNDARDIIKLLAKLEASSKDRVVVSRIASACPTKDHWCALFTHLSLDQASFRIDLGVARPELISRLCIWCEKFRGSDLELAPKAVEVYGFTCLLRRNLATGL